MTSGARNSAATSRLEEETSPRDGSMSLGVEMAREMAIDQSVVKDQAFDRAGDVLVLKKALKFRPGEYHFADVHDLERLLEDNHRVVDENDKEFVRLRDSILLAGVKEEIQLFLEKGESGPKVTIVAGHRRTRVVRSLREIGNHILLPAKLIVPEDSQDKATVINRYVAAAVTNIVRQKLRGIERARAIQDLLKSGMRVDQVTLTLGVNRKVVERSQNLLLLPDEAQDFITRHIHVLREKAIFAIAQDYKNKAVRIGAIPRHGVVIDPDGKIADELRSLNKEIMAVLEAEVSGGRLDLDSAPGGEKPVAKARKAKASTAIPEGHRILNEEHFKARLVIDKVPGEWQKVVLAALEESIAK